MFAQLLSHYARMYLCHFKVVFELGESKLNGVMASPPFHIMGIILQLMVPLYSSKPVVMWDISDNGASAPISTPEKTLQAMMLTGCSSTMIVPSFLVTWASNEEAVTFLAQMDYVVCSIFMPFQCPKRKCNKVLHFS